MVRGKRLLEVEAAEEGVDLATCFEEPVSCFESPIQLYPLKNPWDHPTDEVEMDVCLTLGGVQQTWLERWRKLEAGLEVKLMPRKRIVKDGLDEHDNITTEQYSTVEGLNDSCIEFKPRE